jgi:hypothetical protein
MCNMFYKVLQGHDRMIRETADFYKVNVCKTKQKAIYFSQDIQQINVFSINKNNLRHYLGHIHYT